MSKNVQNYLIDYSISPHVSATSMH